jgi:hypothetical protein
VTQQHTPGPWTIADKTDIRDGDGLIARVATAWAGNGIINANARLIAAAPELLEALEKMLGDFSTYGALEVEAAKARAAIAKARGED